MTSTSPDWSGLRLEAIYAFGGVAGSMGSGQTYSGAVSYGNARYRWPRSRLHIDNGSAALSSRGTTSADSIFKRSVNNAYASSRSIDITRAGGNYVHGDLTVGGYYSFSQYSPDACSTFRKSEKYHNGEVYVLWQLTAALQAEIGYDYMKSYGDSSAKQNQFALGVDYFLSKRTDVYGVASGQSGAGAAPTMIGSNNVDSGSNKQAQVVVGMHHRF